MGRIRHGGGGGGAGRGNGVVGVAVGEGSGLGGLRGSFDVSGAAALLTDARGVIASWSRRAEELLGYAADDVLGRAVGELLAPDDAARVPAVVERCRAEGSWSGVLSVRHRDGRFPGGEVQLVALQDDQGALQGDQGCVVWLMWAGVAAGTAMERGMVGRVVAQLPVGLAVLDTDLRFVWSNPALDQFCGGTAAEERRGRRLGPGGTRPRATCDSPH
ncbi:PAS domain-containing protein [Streptomyces sp. NPDC002851]